MPTILTPSMQGGAVFLGILVIPDRPTSVEDRRYGPTAPLLIAPLFTV